MVLKKLVQDDEIGMKNKKILDNSLKRENNPAKLTRSRYFRGTW